MNARVERDSVNSKVDEEPLSPGETPSESDSDVLESLRRYALLRNRRDLLEMLER